MNKPILYIVWGVDYARSIERAMSNANIRVIGVTNNLAVLGQCYGHLIGLEFSGAIFDQMVIERFESLPNTQLKESWREFTGLVWSRVRNDRGAAVNYTSHSFKCDCASCKRKV